MLPITASTGELFFSVTSRDFWTFECKKSSKRVQKFTLLMDFLRPRSEVPMCVSACVVGWQELILGKVKEDELVRVKISQSSALRPKRGHPDINERPDLQESGALAGPNNNVVDTKSEKNGIIHSSGTSVEAKSASDKLIEVMSCSDGSTKEESITTGSLSEIAKFESKSDFCHPLSPTIFKRSRPTVSPLSLCV